MKDCLILIYKKLEKFKMANSQNDIDIYYAVGNANTKRQENEIASIMKIRNEADWKLISTSTAV